MKVHQEKMFDAPPVGSTLFDRFWSAYPRKVSKGTARKTWENLGPDKDMTDTIVYALDAQKRWRKREAKTNRRDSLPPWKYPATWLNGECWSDEIPSSGGYMNQSEAKTSPCQCGEPSLVYNGEGKWCAKCFVDRFTNHRGLHEKVQQQIGMGRKDKETSAEYAKRCRQYCIERGFHTAPPGIEGKASGSLSVHGEVEGSGPESELPTVSAYY